MIFTCLVTTKKHNKGYRDTLHTNRIEKKDEKGKEEEEISSPS